MTKNTRFWLSTSSCLSLILSASVTAQAAEKLEQDQTVELPTVQVEANRESDEGYNVTEPSLSKITTPLLDTPQTITEVPRELLNDQNATTLRQALRNVPGISLAAGEGGSQGDNLTVRGFSARSDIFRDGMRDFGSYYRDPFNLERVEVLKGPASLLFGRGSTGGIINQVSKTPQLGDFNRSTVTIGSNSTLRDETDTNQQIDSNTAFRLNVMGNYNEVEGRDEGEFKRYAIAPSLAFGLGTDTRLNLDYFHQTEDNVPDYGIPYLESRPAPVDYSNFYGFADHDYFHTSADIATVRAEYDITNDATIRNQSRYGFYTRDVQITEARFAPVPPLGTPPAAITVQRGQIAAKSKETFLSNQTDLNAEFQTLGLNKAATGLELTHETSDPKRFGFTGVPPTNLANPDPDDDYSDTDKDVTSNVESSADTIAVYAVDTLSLNDQWDVTAGLRYDWVESDYQQTTGTNVNLERTDKMLSYRAGVVYKPVRNRSRAARCMWPMAPRSTRRLSSFRSPLPPPIPTPKKAKYMKSAQNGIC